VVSQASTRDLRASDADREAACERLHTAAVDGRLDPSELEERMSAALSARWCSELGALTADVTPPPAPAPRLIAPTFVRRPPTNGLAIASLVLGVLWMWWIGSVLAIVFGHIALNQIARSPHGQPGRGMALTGLAFGYLSLVVPLLVAVFAIVPG
jgi:hypothetical protein